VIVWQNEFTEKAALLNFALGCVGVRRSAEESSVVRTAGDTECKRLNLSS